MSEANGHKPNGHADPFGELMTRRVKPVPLTFEYEDDAGQKVSRTFNFEIRESTYGEAKPLLASAGTMDSAEFGQRLIGLAVYLDGIQLTYERVLNMTPATIGKLMELVPTVIDIFRLNTDEVTDEVTDETADEAEAVPAIAAAATGTATEGQEKKD